jgi:flagellar basal-body rod protein FlgC
MDLMKSLAISASGLKAQGSRMRVISENLANADSEAPGPGIDPYRRKLISFRSHLDRQVDAQVVGVQKITYDKTDFEMRYDPSHPGADADGYTRMPNVKPLIELMDMREAQRTYEANLNVIEASRTMLMRTIDLLRT